MKRFLFATAGLLLSILTHAIPFESRNAEPVTWYKLPSGLPPQYQTRMVVTDGMRYPVGRINRYQDLVLNIEQESDITRGLIHRYNLTTGNSEPLGSQDGFCMRTFSVATLRTGIQRYEDVVAGIRSHVKKNG